ncbi:hypothetical protein [Geodermatophilus obscurus]|uniref:hypothetical protein n=1 Tax=Geodermatophilus obscurus TaxID=1861 RepID=UPI00158820E9|nr:hypothetical protein [Geodermatophilus obscurus]
MVGDQLGDAPRLEGVDGGRPVGVGGVEIHPTDALQAAGQRQGEHAAQRRGGDEQVVEDRPAARQHRLGAEDRQPGLGGQQARPAAGGELQAFGRRGDLAAGRQRGAQVALPVDAQPDPLHGEHGGGARQPDGEQVRVVGTAGALVQRLGEADGDVHGRPLDVPWCGAATAGRGSEQTCPRRTVRNPAGTGGRG